MIRSEVKPLLAGLASLLMLAPVALSAETDKADKKPAETRAKPAKSTEEKTSQPKGAQPAPAATAAPAPQGSAAKKTRTLAAPPSAGASAPGLSPDGARTGDPLGGLPGNQQPTGEKAP